MVFLFRNCPWIFHAKPKTPLTFAHSLSFLFCFTLILRAASVFSLSPSHAEALRLVRRLPKDSRPYYAKYLRENFVNYREVEVKHDQALHDLFNRVYVHSLWVLNKYSVDESTADKLKKICSDS